MKLSPAPYLHWTLKECVEQPEAIARALGFDGRLTYGNVQLGGLEKMKDELRRVKYLTLSACGTSLTTAKYAEKLMKRFLLWYTAWMLPRLTPMTSPGNPKWPRNSIAPSSSFLSQGRPRMLPTL